MRNSPKPSIGIQYFWINVFSTTGSAGLPVPGTSDGGGFSEILWSVTGQGISWAMNAEEGWRRIYVQNAATYR